MSLSERAGTLSALFVLEVKREEKSLHQSLVIKTCFRDLVMSSRVLRTGFNSLRAVDPQHLERIFHFSIFIFYVFILPITSHVLIELNRISYLPKKYDEDLLSRKAFKKC